MTIHDIMEARGITEILHFTTNYGLVGILDRRAVLPRNQLSATQRLRHILRMNANRVLDPAWKSYVHLSVSRINTNLFAISSRWHPDVWWSILSFSPEIMEHDGVYFPTTNNAYPSVVRATEVGGLERLFAPQVLGRYQTLIDRPAAMAPNLPTCGQAEILYPGELSTQFLRTIYVRTVEEQDDVCGQIDGTNHPPCRVIVSPEKFSNR